MLCIKEKIRKLICFLDFLSEIRKNKEIDISKVNGINNEIREKKIIVSLTSYPKRFSHLDIVIKSLLNQSMKPDYIILYLGEDSKNVKLPHKLTDLTSYGLEIKYEKDDLKPHKKYYYAMQQFPDAIIITVDDDAVYDINMIRDLYSTYEKHPRCVVARRAHEIVFDESGNRLSYSQWKYEVKSTAPSYRYIATGVGSVLYPPNLISEHKLFDKELIKKVALFTDDLWLKYFEVRNKVPVIPTNSKISHPLILPGSESTGLAKQNVANNNNDISMDLIEKSLGRTMYQLIIDCENSEL